jgi:alpha-L-rhamnosidase
MISHSMNNTLRYTCRAGKQAYTSLVWRGLRYLIVAVHSASTPVTFTALNVHLATYSALPQGSFRSSDLRLNGIWEMSAYTLRLCSQDAYMDCPTYEQTMWVGDAAVDALVQQAVYDRMEFVERNLFLAADSLERTPIVNCQVPSGWEDDLLPNWSWLWVMACRICYQFTGSVEFACKIYPYLARQAEFVDRSRMASSRGLFEFPGAWHLLDWAPLDVEPNSIVAHENALAVVALRATAEMADIAGVPAEAARWQAAAAGIAAAIDREFWSPEKNAYIDSIHEDGQLSPVVSQPTNVCLLYSDVVSQEHAAAISPYIVEPGKDWVPVGSPFMVYFTGEVLARQKRFPELLGIIRERWGDMLDKGATTTWETFRGWTEDLMYGMWTRSWCHAWSSSPAFFLSRYILGVSPLKPGFTYALIAPQLCDLTWAEGSAPTPHGAIQVRAERWEGRLAIQVHLPAAISAEVRLPASGGKVTVSGVTAEYHLEDAEVVIQLPPGAHATFEV